jgi:DcmR-like sensory protein
MVFKHDLLTQPAYGSHLAQTYADEQFLIEGVCKFIAGGLSLSEAAAVIATPDHTKAFINRLTQKGIDANAAIASGQLQFLDANEVLPTLMKDGIPHWETFESVIGKIVDDIKIRYEKVRLYGEMVNILWQNEEYQSTITLESFWNRLAVSRPFTLLCGYSIDNLNQDAYEGPLQCVCNAHSHLIPGQDVALLDKAVTEAGKEILGTDFAKLLHSLKSRQFYDATHMPSAQATLFFLQATMPQHAAKVLSQVRNALKLEKTPL